MNEKQQLYQLQKALQVKIVSQNEMEKIEAPYERRKKACPEATEAKNAEVRLRELENFDARKRKRFLYTCLFLSGLAILTIILALTYPIIEHVYVKYDLRTLTELGLPAFLGLYYFFVSATMFLICAPWNIDFFSTKIKEGWSGFKISKELEIGDKIKLVLSIFWSIIAIASYVGMTIYFFGTYEDFWSKLSGLLMPILAVIILIVLVFQFLGSIFSGNWDLFLFNISTLCPYLLLLLSSIVILVIMKHVGKRIGVVVEQKNFTKEDDIRECMNNIKRTQSKLREAEQKIDNERNQNPQYIKISKVWYQASNAVDCSSVVAESDKDLNTVTSIIWCFEQHYADSVKEAKQWLAQQAHYRDVQNQLRSIHREVQKTNSTLDVMNMKLDDIGVQLDKIYEAIPSSVDVTVEVRNEITFS